MVDQLSGLDSTPHLLATLTLAERRIGEAIAARSQSGDVVTRGSHARLLHLVPPEGARQSELAEGWISKQAVGKRVQEMVAAGLLTVEPDPDDGRATIVRRTPEGDRILVLITGEMVEFEAELAARVGARRYRTFRAVLDELATP